MTQAVERKFMPGFFSMKQYTTPASQGNLFINVFDLRQQTTDLGRHRQMETALFQFICTPNKFVVLPLDTRPLLPHLSTDSDRYPGTNVIRDQRAVRKLTLNPSSLFIYFFYYYYLFILIYLFIYFLSCGGPGVSRVQTIANSPLVLRHVGFESEKDGTR